METQAVQSKFIRTLSILGSFSLSVCISACGGGGGSSFSLLADSDIFHQSAGSVNNKVDVLWMIDNSGSMQSSQSNVINNLNSFIQDFQTKNLDFKMAVATTDAWRTEYGATTRCAEFRDRILNSSCNTIVTKPSSGYHIIDALTPNLNNVFLTNASQTDSANNIYGSGDERAFSSIKTAMDLNLNAGFLRADSFFAIIIVSDEDDFSHSNTTFIESYTDPIIHPISNYTTYLDTLTGSDPTNRRYSVNAMAIQDTTCLAQLNTSFSGRKIGVRYNALVDDVNTGLSTYAQGLKTSLCGNFAEDLEDIADNILTLSTKFKLARIPIPETISVQVDGETVPNKDENIAGTGGWLYEATNNEVLFFGAYIPPAGAAIKVNYDPASYGN